MDVGSRELTRAITAYLLALAFAVTFLLTSAFGGSLGASLTRALLVALAVKFAAPMFVRPVIVTVLDAMARDTKRRADQAAADGADGNGKS